MVRLRKRSEACADQDAEETEGDDQKDAKYHRSIITDLRRRGRGCTRTTIYFEPVDDLADRCRIGRAAGAGRTSLRRLNPEAVDVCGQDVGLNATGVLDRVGLTTRSCLASCSHSVMVVPELMD